MVDFTTPDLPGASAVYNKIASKVDAVEKSVMGKLESTASDLKAALEPDLLDLKTKTQGMIPELSTLPTLNLQSEISALSGLSAGSDAYAAKLATLATSFGSSISAGGYSLDSIVSAGASALSGAASALAAGTSAVSASSALSAAIPNFELPAGATEAVELAKAALQPDVDVVKEAASKFSTDESVDEVKAVYGDVVSKKEEESVQAAAAEAPAAAVSKEKAEYQRLNELYDMQKHARGAEKLRVKIMKIFESMPDAGARWQKRGPYPLSKPGQSGVNPYTDGNIPIPMPEPDNIIKFDDVVTALYKV